MQKELTDEKQQRGHATGEEAVEEEEEEEEEETKKRKRPNAEAEQAHAASSHRRSSVPVWKSKMLVSLLRYGGEYGELPKHFEDFPGLVEGVQQWARMPAIVEETGMGIRDLGQGS